ncbi:MAG: DUF1905 domain-containing protein [Candidatus Paceibacterota bacterium]
MQKKRTGKGKIKKQFKFKSKVIVWREGARDGEDKGAWRFARVPENISIKIKEMQKGRLRRGWGAVYARAKIKKSEWVTSVFPDRHSNTYILPLKKQIRYEENLYDGSDINVSIEIWF